METMFDSVNIENIPENSPWVAGYVNGIWPTYDSLVKKFPNANHVSITINAYEAADVLDVEKGDAQPDQVITWVKAMRENGRTPVVYCGPSTMGQIQNEFIKANEAEPFFWVADWTGVPHLYPGSVATQWADGSETYPGLAKFCDTSLVSPNWPKKKTSVVHSLEKKVIPMKFTNESLSSIFRQLVAYAGIASQLANTGHFPVAVRTAIVTVSGVLLSVEHYAAKP